VNTRCWLIQGHYPPARIGLLQWLDDRGITPYIRVKESHVGKSDLHGIEKFTYLPEQNRYFEVRRHQSAEPDRPLLLNVEAVTIREAAEYIGMSEAFLTLCASRKALQDWHSGLIRCSVLTRRVGS
jgi:hypothetical protein